MRVVPVAAALALSALAAHPASAKDPVVAEKPFPVDRGQILREEGVTYVVEGRKRIPKGVEISCQKDVYVIGKGKDAILEVEGSLQVHGVSSREVIFENVWIEPQAQFEELRLDKCIFRSGGGIRTIPKEGVEGRFFLENSTFSSPTSVSGTFCAGEQDLHATTFSNAVTLKAVTPKGASGNRCQLFANGCTFTGGLSVEGYSDVTIRTNTLQGAKASFKDCLKLVFDANKVESSVLEIRQSEPGRFKDARMEKCDVYTPRIVLWAPVKQGLNETLVCDKCWFKGVTDEKALRSTVFVDGDDDPKCGVRIRFQKIGEKPLELAGSKNR